MQVGRIARQCMMTAAVAALLLLLSLPHSRSLQAPQRGPLVTTRAAVTIKAAPATTTQIVTTAVQKPVQPSSNNVISKSMMTNLVSGGSNKKVKEALARLESVLNMILTEKGKVLPERECSVKCVNKAPISSSVTAAAALTAATVAAATVATATVAATSTVTSVKETAVVAVTSEAKPSVQKCVPTCNALECLKNKATFVKLDKLGYEVFHCGVYLFYSYLKMTYADAAETCCKLGKQLVTLENEMKIKCMANKPAKLMGIEWTEYTDFWTSGTYNNCTQSFWWCDRNKNVIKSDIGQATDDVPKNMAENCLRGPVVSNKPKLKIWPCSKKAFFVCEKVYPEDPDVANNCMKPKCPEVTCQRDETKIALIEKSSATDFTKVSSKCGNFWLASYKATFEEAIRACCEIGTKVLSLESYADKTCLRSSYSGQWKGLVNGFAMWSSGTDQGCFDKWKWCDRNETFTKNDYQFFTQKKWYTEERCVAFEANPYENFLPQVECSAKFEFICEDIPDYL